MTMPKLNKCRFGEIMHAFEGKWFQKIGTNPNNYRLKEPVLNLKSLCGVAGFSVITPPNLNRFGWNLEYKCGTTVHTRTKNCTKCHQNVFCFFLSPIPCGLSDTYPVPISTMFETTDVNRCARVYTREKFPNFCIGVL